MKEMIQLAPLGFGICGEILVLINLAVGLIDYIRSRSREKNCTVHVVATLTDVTRRILPGNKRTVHLFMPVYTYYLNGLKKTVTDRIGHVDTNIYTIGTEVEMEVDPRDARHFKIPGNTAQEWKKNLSESGKMAALFLGLMVLGLILCQF